MQIRLCMQLTCVAALLLTMTLSAHSADPCGVGTTGNVDVTGVVDLTDLSNLIGYLTVPGVVLACPDEANVNALGGVDLTDLSMLIGYLTLPGVVLPPCPNAVPLIPASERASVLASAHQQVVSLKALPNDQFLDAMLAYFQGSASFEASGIDSQYFNVWARFTDGVSLIVTRSIDFSPDTLPGEALPSLPADLSEQSPGEFSTPNVAITRSASFGPDDLPGSTKARVLQAVGNGFPSVATTTNRIISWLTQKGYQISSTSSTISSLKHVSGDGLLYYLGHGGAVRPRTGGVDYAISTTNPAVLDADVARYENDLAAGRLCIVDEPVDYDEFEQPVSELRFAATTKFITAYWGNFADHAVVFMNACRSDSATAFKAAIQAKNGPAYFGWSTVVNCVYACDNAEFMIDRMLGINKHYRHETPAQRPFDVTSVFSDLQSRGMHLRQCSNPHTGFQTRFNYTPGSGNFGILAPSLRFMQVLEHQDTIEVTGIFGHDPGTRGKLIVGGTELPIGSWEPGIIIAFIPNTGVGSVGPVTVEVDGRVSNTVNLTEWNGLMTYHHYDAGSLQGRILIHCHFRADVHSFRESPKATPVTNTLYISACEDSYGSVKAMGTYSLTEPGDPPVTTTWDWTDSTYLPGLWEMNPAGFLMVGPLNPSAKTWDLQLAAASSPDMKEIITYSNSNAIDTVALGFSYYYELYDDLFLRRLHLTFDNVWNINPRIMQKDEACCSHNPDVPEIWHDIVWPVIPASWAPDPDAAQ